jgi:uncharacterized protein (UPF0276 family)
VIKLTTNLSDPLLDLLQSNEAPVDAIEVGPWLSLRQIRIFRKRLPGLPFYFHGGDLINQVGLFPGAISRIIDYQLCTDSPWVSMHLTMWLPGMVRLMFRYGFRFPIPDPEKSARRFIRNVKRLASAVHGPILLENPDPLPFDGYASEVQTKRITNILDATDCGFLLDIGHARVSAAVLGMDACEYLSSLPLDRVMQVHVSGPRFCDGRLVDAHQPLLEADYELLDYVLQKTKPQVVTLEYIREKKALQEQLSRLRGRLDAQRNTGEGINYSAFSQTLRFVHSE